MSAKNNNAIAMLVMNSRSGPVLCPFFAKCHGVLLVYDSGHSFNGHDCADPKSLCDLIVELHPRALICGFIGDVEKRKLQRAGIDIRLGACSCSIDELAAGFADLPRA